MPASFLARRPFTTAPTAATTKAILPRTNAAVRLAAWAASAVITWGIVSALASYGLPADEGASLLAAAKPSVQK